MTNQNYTCKDYREEMILLGLKKQYNDENITPAKRKEIEKEIHNLEKKLGMD